MIHLKEYRLVCRFSCFPMSGGRCDHNHTDNLSRERAQVGVASQYNSAELTEYFHTIVTYLFMIGRFLEGIRGEMQLKVS